jgi:hypothetical protein
MKDENKYNNVLKNMEKNMHDAAIEASKRHNDVTAHWLFSRAKDLQEFNKKKGL